MPRPRQRVCLQDGLSLNLNRLARREFIQPGATTGPVGIKWKNSIDKEIASALITADMRGPDEGWFRIQIGRLDQHIDLVSHPRHYRRQAVVFHLPLDEPTRIGVVEATRRSLFRVSAGMGAASRLRLAIFQPG